MQVDIAAESLLQLVQQLRLPVTRRSVYEELQRHPDHPSLLAFSDVLRGWGVPNGAYKVAEEELKDLPTPFLAHTVAHGSEFQVIKQIEADRIITVAQPQRPVELTLAEFGQLFTGHVLLAEHSSAISKQKYQQHRRREQMAELRRPLLWVATGALLLLLLVHSAIIQIATWNILGLLVVKSGGLILSILLLSQSLGQQNSLLQRLCNSGKNRSCNAILTSQAAKLTKNISWAEVGFFYFSGTWLTLLLVPEPMRLLPVLALVSLLGLPFTVYSLYYQARVARQWCVLCCSVQAVLWLEFLISSAYLIWPLTWPSQAVWGTMLSGLLIPMFGWSLLKPLLIQAQEAATLRQQLGSFKRNQDLFEHALAEQPCYELLPPTEAIRLGSPSARHIITVVTSPTCPPCARAHATLNEWLTHRDDIQVQVIFIVPNSLHNIDYQSAVHFMTLQQHQPTTVPNALHTWYNQEKKDYAAWAKLYPTLSNAPATEWLPKHHAWCRWVGVVATPTILLNGQRLPELYQLEDIKYFL